MLFRKKRTKPAVATVKPRPTMTSLAERRVMTSDMARPTTAPIAQRGKCRQGGTARLRRDNHRYERAGQHHRFEAEIDEAADTVDETADRREQDRGRHHQRGMEEGVDHGALLRRFQMSPRFATAKIITAPCRISTISIGTSLNSWMLAPAEDRAPNRMAAMHDANCGIARKQRDGDAGEAVARRKAADEAMDKPKRMDAPREASDRSRGDHGREEDWRRLNADRAAETRIEADEA